MKTLAPFFGAALLLAVGFFFYELKRPPTHVDIPSADCEPAARAPVTIYAKAPSGPAHLPPAAAKMKPVPYVVSREMRDPENLPLRHAVMAGPSDAPPPDPFHLPETELVARGGTVP